MDSLEEFRKIWIKKRQYPFSQFINDLIYPLRNDCKKILIYKTLKTIYQFTLLKTPALFQLYDHVQDIDQENIPGAILEMGCWRGGAGALMAYTTEKNNSGRKTWFFDSFAGFPKLSSHDIAPLTDNNRPLGKGDLYMEQKDAEEIIQKMKLKNYQIIPGWFQESLPKYKLEIGPIALLHLDCDLYESVQYCLEELYDQVSVGGYIVFDDYFTWPGSRKALFEFIKKRDLYPAINVYPNAQTAFLRKE